MKRIERVIKLSGETLDSYDKERVEALLRYLGGLGLEPQMTETESEEDSTETGSQRRNLPGR